MSRNSAPPLFVLAVRLLRGHDPERQWRGLVQGPRRGGAEYYQAAAVLATVACVAFLAASLGTVAALGQQLPWWTYHLLVAIFVLSLGVVYSLRSAADGLKESQSVSALELTITWLLVAAVILLTLVLDV